MKTSDEIDLQLKWTITKNIYIFALTIFFLQFKVRFKIPCVCWKLIYCLLQNHQ